MDRQNADPSPWARTNRAMARDDHMGWDRLYIGEGQAGSRINARVFRDDEIERGRGRCAIAHSVCWARRQSGDWRSRGKQTFAPNARGKRDSSLRLE